MEQYGLTQEKTADRVGKSRPVIANALRLLSLPDEVLELLVNEEISQSHARLLLELPKGELQITAAKTIVKDGLTVRATSALVKKLLNPPKPEPEPDPDEIDYLAILEKDIEKSLGRKVKIVRGKKKGRIEIEYYGEEDFENFCEMLKNFGKINK